MKSPLIIGVSALALLTLSATLFAQTTTGSSLITQMKAAVHDFTLATDLNPGVTDLKSGPVSGKKTGDMLTAEEYNRILELVGQGGGGKFEINDSTTKTDYSMVYPELGAYNAAKWRGGTNTVCGDPIPDGCREIITAQHDFCHVTAIAGNGPHVLLNYNGNKKYRIVTARYANQSTHIGVTCYDNIGTGGGGSGGGGISDIKIVTGSAVSYTNSTLSTIATATASCPANYKLISGGCGGNNANSAILRSIATANETWSCDFVDTVNYTVSNTAQAQAICVQMGGGAGSGGSGWVDVPLTDTAKFDESCEYRATFVHQGAGLQYVPYVGSSSIGYMAGVNTDHLTFNAHLSTISHIDYQSKSVYRVNGASNTAYPAITKIEKFCRS
ncbi:hypothetical protein KBB89_02795 [Candidatus Gracilibacteria bacterium]|nr:hypothetical protein [Candidatus Gracilibacteria bacterium]